ncbi:MAG: LruC domain-containing protein [Microscillaceae bacterium]|nr:LruC domain-containing protein [Microscillaceae bacterium]
MIPLNNKLVSLLGVMLFLISSCRDLETNPTPDNENITDIEALAIPENFDFSTSQAISLNLSVKNTDDQNLSGITVKICDADPSLGGKTVASGRTDEDGKFILDFNFPSSQDSVFIVSNYPGLPNVIGIPAKQNISYTLGGNKDDDDSRKFNKLISPKSGSPKANSFTYMGNYNGNGLPTYLIRPNEVFPQDILDNVNASLPELRPVPAYNPEYLSGNIISNTNLKDSADVWVTFVHEGAGWRNALGYYTYTIGNPPASINDISKLNIIFPNSSYVGSGGAMLSGDKVYLGKFPPNTSIGWFLVPNGWSGSSVNFAGQMKFSDENLNTFTNEANRRHIVLLKDEVNELLLLGVEDQSRPNGDQDFNDAVFFVTANPFTAVITENLEDVKKACDDADKDGVCDNEDDYPNDDDKAYNNYIPGENTYATIAFEDLWPQKGDYDFNDLVVDYQLNAISNASNRVVEVRGQFITRASGASFENGFGFQLPILASRVASVTGTELTENYITLTNTGVEAGQSKAVVIVYDNIYNQINKVEGFYFNTQDNAPKIGADTVNITMIFTSPITLTDLQGFNPFVISNKRRGHEIHLLGKLPTDLFDNQLLGTADDASNVNLGKYYQTQQGLPFGITLPSSFAYPKEGKTILDAYTKFGSWAQSGGTTFADWYLNLPTYRKTENIYNK